MPDLTPKIAPGSLNLHPNTAPSLNVPPVLEHGGPTPDPFTAMQHAVEALQAQVAALTGRVAELEKQMVAVRLVLQGIDPAFAKVNADVAALRAEYSTHAHALPFTYESFDFLTNTPGNNKPNFLIPYVWEGTHQQWTDFQKQQDAEKYGRTTSPPQQKS